MKEWTQYVQQLGSALVLPIAVLPAAGLLLRVGQPDFLDIEFVAAAGNALFSNLGILFTIGVAVGFAKQNHGAAALAGTVCFFVTTFGAKTFISVPPDVLANVPIDFQVLAEAQFKDTALARLSVPIGILSGITAGVLYNRYADIRFPEALGFFAGKRFVPIAAAAMGILYACTIGSSSELLSASITWVSDQAASAGRLGLFVYGVLNRVLIMTGLHHVLNSVVWFVLGEYNGATGDLNRFFAGDPEAGSFMAGFFPVMMFGLPGACFAMYRTAPKANRKKVGGLVGSMALTSFLTGITEPIEFAFLFQAPILFAVHAILTGLSMVLMDVLNVKLGFGFSAGLFDYALNYRSSTNPHLMLPVGIIYSVLYYLSFSYAIRRFGLQTIGGEMHTGLNEQGERSAEHTADQSQSLVSALGGAANITTVDACTTRLRLGLEDTRAIDEQALWELGSKGVVRLSERNAQVVLGPSAERIAQDLRDYLRIADQSVAEHLVDTPSETQRYPSHSF